MTSTGTTRPKNAVERRLDLLRELWLDATSDERVRVVVWRVPGNAQRLLLAFLEAQRHEGWWQAPDLFLKFDAPFETGFSYSRTLCDALCESYVASRDGLREQGIAFDWPFATVARPDSAAGFIHLLGDFAQHHQAQFRYAVAALMPAPVNSDEALNEWVRAALRAGPAANVRLALVDTQAQPRWDRLARDFKQQVRLVEAPIDMFDVARETAAQSPGGGAQAAYRQLLTDVLALVDKGTPAQVSARADKALVIARRERWPDQEVVLHMAVAGAHVKARDAAAAIARYRQAREVARGAEAAGSPVGGNLVMQTWFGEAGVWITADQWLHAAQAYRSGAEEARRIGNAMFALEGFRMAGYCHARRGDTHQAREHGVLALREGKAMAPDERAPSTLALALQDLLRLQDAPRTAELERLAQVYQSEMAAAHSKAETDGAALGPQPANEAVDRIEAAMHERFESAFQHLREAREAVIAQGDEFFRKVVAMGRELLHAHWNGLPEVKHPLDHTPEMWARMPQSARLPDPPEPQALLDAGAAARPATVSA